MSELWVTVAVVAVLAGASTMTLLALVRRWSLRLALLDEPNHRSSHVVPTPRLGGIAVALTMLTGMLISAQLGLAGTLERQRLLMLALVGAIISAVSLLDDLRSLGAPIRLGVHLAAGAAVVLALDTSVLAPGGIVDVLGVPVALASVVAAIWIAWFINAFNFMDGIDGIAGVQALSSGVSWMLFGWLTGNVTLLACGALLVGCMLGFLTHNWSPARIFMGDAGSALLGFLLATVPWVLGSDRLWLPMLCVLWPFLFDTMVTLVRRTLKGERPWEAHRTHLYQQLVVGGWSHRSVATLYGVLSLLGVIASLALTGGGAWQAALAVCALLLAGAGLCGVVASLPRASAS